MTSFFRITLRFDLKCVLIKREVINNIDLVKNFIIGQERDLVKEKNREQNKA